MPASFASSILGGSAINFLRASNKREAAACVSSLELFERIISTASRALIELNRRAQSGTSAGSESPPTEGASSDQTATIDHSSIFSPIDGELVVSYMLRRTADHCRSDNPSDESELSGAERVPVTGPGLVVQLIWSLGSGPASRELRAWLTLLRQTQDLALPRRCLGEQGARLWGARDDRP